MLLGKSHIHKQKNEVGPLPTSYTEVNSKWIKGINIRVKTIKLLKEKFHDIDFGSDSSGTTLQATTTTTKKQINWTSSKLETCCIKGHYQL